MKRNARPAIGDVHFARVHTAEVAPILLIAPSRDVREPLGAALGERIEADDYSRGLLLAEQELPSVVFVEVSRRLTAEQLQTITRLHFMAPHARLVAAGHGLTKAEGRFLVSGCKELHLTACSWGELVAHEVAESAREYRADYLREAMERMPQAKVGR